MEGREGEKEWEGEEGKHTREATDTTNHPPPCLGPSARVPGRGLRKVNRYGKQTFSKHHQVTWNCNKKSQSNLGRAASPPLTQRICIGYSGMPEPRRGVARSKNVGWIRMAGSGGGAPSGVQGQNP